jgi:hypothetical protein
LGLVSLAVMDMILGVRLPLERNADYSEVALRFNRTAKVSVVVIFLERVQINYI